MDARRSDTARTTFVWAILCVMTVVSAVVAATREGDRGGGNVVGLGVLVIGALKAAMIAEEFMEVRTAPPWIQWTARAWLIGVVAVVAVLYLQ